MINVFARTFTDDLASLVKQIDETVTAHQDQKLSAFVVFLTDDSDATEPQIKQLADSSGIGQTPLTMFESISGPPAYKIAQDADVTVMLWRNKRVRNNFAFREGELNADHIKEIVAQAKSLATE